MKALIFEEIKNAIFEVDLTSQGAPLQANSDDVQTVLDHLGVDHKTLFAQGHSTIHAPRLPRGGFGAETSSYTPLTHFLNAIIHTANSRLTGARYLGDLRFDPYDVEMLDKVNSDRPLKPDILGLLHPRAPDDKSSWKDVAAFIEVKGQPVDAIKQLATYARSHLVLDRRRSFSISMTFDHKALALRFYCFHRSGASISPQLRLNRQDGFRSAVKHIVGIMSIPDEEAFGLDLTRGEDLFCLNGHNYGIERTIQNRESIRGHSTVVYSLKRRATGAQVTPSSLQSRKLTLVGVSELPEKIIYKLSYQPEGRPSEGSLFAKFRGEFGIVDIIGFHVCTAKEIFGSTDRYFLDARFLPVGDVKTGDNETREPELRYLHCIAMALEGLRLVDTSDSDPRAIPTPPELVETIFHSIIGHYNLFRGGILHRDVSCGNILRLRNPIERHLGRFQDLIEKTLGQDVDLSQCRGILIDGDHAIKWRERAIGLSSERSGTLPFMSTHLLNAWDGGDQALHTAADDLESFLWVLVWSLVNIFKKVATINNRYSKILRLDKALSGSNFNDILRRETLIEASWHDKVFKGLITDWLKISRHSRFTVLDYEMKLRTLKDDGDAEKDILDELDKHCGEVYEKFIRTGYEHLKTIRREYPTWRDVVDYDGSLFNL
jgi:hypothetical protein